MQTAEEIKYLEGKLAARDVPANEMEEMLTDTLATDDRLREAGKTVRQLTALVIDLNSHTDEPTDMASSLLQRAIDKARDEYDMAGIGHYHRMGLEAGLSERMGGVYDYTAVKATYAAAVCKLAGELTSEANLKPAHRQTLKEAAHIISRTADGLID